MDCVTYPLMLWYKTLISHIPQGPSFFINHFLELTTSTTLLSPVLYVHGITYLNILSVPLTVLHFVHPYDVFSASYSICLRNLCLLLSPCTLSIWVHFIISLGYLCIHCFSINFQRKKEIKLIIISQSVWKQ